MRWYNVDHRHSGIRYVSPAQRHNDTDQSILAARHALYTRARERNPIIASDPSADRHSEFRQVQAAKLLHRMASGTHRRWERNGPGGSLEVTELHKYPASRGRVLRHLGEQLERIAELVGVPFITQHLGQQP